MPAIEFPEGLIETEDLPKTKRTLINCFNNNQGQVISRPGIANITTTGRVARGQFVWNGSLYQIQSEELHKITNLTTGASTNIGTIAGSEPVFTAIGFNTATLVVKGGKLYTLDTSDVLTDISGNANFVPCDALAHINGRFVYIPSNGDPAFFSDVGAAGTVQVLSFFDAEELPDKNNNVFNFKNTLYIMGTDSIELFRDTGASPNPFGRISGARLTNGFIGGLLEYNETFLFIGREKDQSAGIYAIGSGIAPKISNSAIDLLLASFTEAQMAAAVMSRFKWRGYDIATFTILTTTFAFFGGNWFELTTLDNSIPGVWQGGFVNQFEGTYFTAYLGKIGKLASVNTDYEIPASVGASASFNVNVDAITNAGTTAAAGIAAGVTLSGFDPAQILTISAPVPTNGIFVAWDNQVGGGGNTRLHKLEVAKDGDVGQVTQFWDLIEYATADLARAAFVGGTMTGASSYTFFILDDPISDNGQGMTVLVEVDGIVIEATGIPIERIIDIGFQDPNNDRFTCQSIELAISQGFNSKDTSVGMSVSKNNVEFTTPIFRDLGDTSEYTDHLEWNFPGGVGTFNGFMGLRFYTTQDVEFATDLLVANFR